MLIRCICSDSLTLLLNRVDSNIKNPKEKEKRNPSIEKEKKRELRGRERERLCFQKRKQKERKMASQPGPLTNWPWHRLGNFKVPFESFCFVSCFCYFWIMLIMLSCCMYFCSSSSNTIKFLEVSGIKIMDIYIYTFVLFY